ncbi:hypothetical protein ACIBI9_42840 [Nonomuraea sp. NPDC050451]|uniref:hypothetical protein n=1 Tax=Nonomuraea sp. NPDC050451 TaxID=3364364 RepID=UPI0037A1A718
MMRVEAVAAMLPVPYRLGLPIHGWAHLEEGLKGAEWTIEQHRPALLLEIEDRHLGKYGRDSAEVAGSLIARGYRMHVWHRADRVSTRRRNYLFVAASCERRR